MEKKEGVRVVPRRQKRIGWRRGKEAEEEMRLRRRQVSPSPPTSNVNDFAEITSTPRIEQPPVSYHEHQLFLESTPGGTELWTRNVAIQSKPQFGQIFEKLEDAISFYNVYAEACGFEPRKSSQKKNADGAIFYKLVDCNREGFRDGKKRKAIVHDSVVEQPLIKPFNIKNNKLTRTGCDAMIEFRLIKDVYAIIDHSKVNLGPTSAYRYSKEHADGYENVGAQLIDFKNFGRDIKCFIGDKDAQLFINHFEDLRETNPGFYFAYEVDSFKCLVRVFWCDAQARQNYSSFGDLDTFDPAYGTNKYSMIFTPFTGVDHHKRSVTFAATLLFHEDEDSFKWVFEKFLDAMGIKKVVPKVFKKAKPRYCMWHIMQKVPDKIGSTISKETNFMSRLNSVVWDSDLEPLEFERKWSELIAEHNLQANSWLSYMYKKKKEMDPSLLS
ncbi:protein FAR1-RELATED SEQUENCE 5-like [Silene latifolia]|uniref:protein FAR1-RELATED SEQUENCE 5-like n=1 Tax=Silene latifolia TaxID=37657 RepID=UPI003D785472